MSKPTKAHLTNIPPETWRLLSSTLCGRVARHESKPEWWGVLWVTWHQWNFLPLVAQCGACRARDPFRKRVYPQRHATEEQITAVECGLVGMSRVWPT